MLYEDLRHFISDLERAGELLRISEPVDVDLELAAITVEMCKMPPGRNKALLFERPKGYDFPVLTNLLGSEKRLSLMAGTRNYAGMTEKLGGFLELLQQPRKTLIDKLGAIGMLRDVSRCFPKRVRRGACQEVIHTGDTVDLTKIPILKTWPMDGGPFVTMPLVFTTGPEDKKRNCGMYRLQLYDKNTLGFHCHTHHTGAEHLRQAKRNGWDRLPVAVAIGAEPAVIFSAVVPLPPGLDEMLFAGFLNEGPVKMVKCVSIDQEVPASAEFVLEGYVTPDEKRWEGPFGDHTGFYSLADDYWVFHVTAITHRKNAIWNATVVGAPPQEDNHITSAIERLFLPLMQQPIHEVIDYRLPFEGVAHNLLLTTIKKSYPGQGRKVAHAIWGLGQAMFTKLIVVGEGGGGSMSPSTTDMGGAGGDSKGSSSANRSNARVGEEERTRVSALQDADKSVRAPSLPPLSDGEGWARYAARFVDAEHDIELVRGPTETLDHATRALYFGSKVSLDLTKPWPGESRDAGGSMSSSTSEDEPTDAELLAKLRERIPGVTAVHSPWQGEWRHLLLVTLDKRVPKDVGVAPPPPMQSTNSPTAESRFPEAASPEGPERSAGSSGEAGTRRARDSQGRVGGEGATPTPTYPQHPANIPGVRDTSMYEQGYTGRDVVAACWELWPELPVAQRVIVFDHGEDLTNLSRLVWLGLSNIDPERDIVFDLQPVPGRVPAEYRRHPRRVGVDCTVKTRTDGFDRQWPLEQTYPEELLARVRSRWSKLLQE